jgi:hypothetical protein
MRADLLVDRRSDLRKRRAVIRPRSGINGATSATHRPAGALGFEDARAEIACPIADPRSVATFPLRMDRTGSNVDGRRMWRPLGVRLDYLSNVHLFDPRAMTTLS